MCFHDNENCIKIMVFMNLWFVIGTVLRDYYINKFGCEHIWLHLGKVPENFYFPMDNLGMISVWEHVLDQFNGNYFATNLLFGLDNLAKRSGT